MLPINAADIELTSFKETGLLVDPTKDPTKLPEQKNRTERKRPPLPPPTTKKKKKKKKKTTSEKSKKDKKQPKEQVEKANVSIPIQSVVNVVSSRFENVVENPLNGHVLPLEQEQQNHKRNSHNRPTTNNTAMDTNSSLSKLTEIAHRIKVGVVFISVALVTGFLFVGAPVVLAIQSSASSTIPNSIRWWWKTDLVEIFFQAAILTAIMQCTMNAVSGARFKCLAAGSILFAWAALLLVTLAATESWTQLKNNTQIMDVNRGGCQSLQSQDGALPNLLLACFEESDDDFVQLTYNNSVVDDASDASVENLAAGLVQLQELGVGDGVTSRLSSVYASSGDLFNLQSHIGLVDPKCFALAVHIQCRNHVRKCRDSDCAPLSSDCLEDKQFSSVKTTIDCLKEKCIEAGSYSDNDCKKINGASVALVIDTKILPEVLRYSRLLGIQNTGLDYNLNGVACTFAQYDEASKGILGIGPSSQENCDDWRIDSNSNSTSKNSSTFSFSNVTCDPGKSEFQLTDESQTFNSSTLSACIVSYFTVVVMLMGKNYQTLKFRCTTVRVGSFLAAILMAVLMYIGSVHLHNAAMENSFQHTKDSQLVWRALYLLVSFLCFTGGLLVLAPAAKDTDTDIRAATGINHDTTAGDSPVSSFCDCCCSCCSGVFVLKSVNAMKAAKAQFWDGEDI